MTYETMLEMELSFDKKKNDNLGENYTVDDYLPVSMKSFHRLLLNNR